MAQNPVPFVNQPLVPTAAAPGGPAFTLKVNGTGFVSGATIRWNGSPRTTTFVSASQLTAAISASDISTASTATVTVVNPTPGGGFSNAVFFPITNPTRDVAFQNAAPVSGTLGPGGFPVQVVTADFTGTGILDLVWYENQTGNFHYSRGNGDGTFQPPAQLTVSLANATATYTDLAVGDFNGDGTPDLVATGYIVPVSGSITQGIVSVFLGGGNGRSIDTVFAGPGPFTERHGLVVGDINGDGKLDMVTLCTEDVPTAGTYQRGICAFTGNGDGTFNLAFSRFYAYPLSVNSIALGDFNGDGKLDIVGSAGYFSRGNQTYIGLLPGTGDGTFAHDQVIYEATDSIFDDNSVAAADLNHDGILDLVLLHDACGSQPAPCLFNADVYDVDFLPGNGDGTFQPPITASRLTIPSISTGISVVPPLFGDFNGDGNLDTVVGNLMLLLRNGSSSTYPLQFAAYVVGDFNGDGRLDLITPFIVSNTPDSFLQPVLQVPPPYDWDTAVSSNQLTVAHGSSVSFTVTITPVNGPNGTVTPGLTNLPPGASVGFNPTTLTGAGTITVTITTSDSTPAGSYSLSGTLTSGLIAHSGTLFLTVQ
jgi:hypothetical protein